MDPTIVLEKILYNLARQYEATEADSVNREIDLREVMMDLGDLAAHLEAGGSKPIVKHIGVNIFKVG